MLYIKSPKPFLLSFPWKTRIFYRSMHKALKKTAECSVQLLSTVASKENFSRNLSSLSGFEKNAPIQEDTSPKKNHIQAFLGTCSRDHCQALRCPSTCAEVWKKVGHWSHAENFKEEAGKKISFISSQDMNQEPRAQRMVVYENPREVPRENIEVDHRASGFLQKNQRAVVEAVQISQENKDE